MEKQKAEGCGQYGQKTVGCPNNVSAKEIDVFYLNAEHSIISLSFQLMKDECL